MKDTQSVTNSINQNPSTASTRKFAAIKMANRWTAFSALSLISILPSVCEAGPEGQAGGNTFVPPAVFQAAGPDVASIQGTVDAYRAALGALVNGNNPGPLTSGRREINWDGGSPAVMATTDPVTPFDTFLNTRGSRFTTPGSGLSQATPTGLATLFNNPTYVNIFATFSPSRLFTPVGSNITEGLFFIPGSNGGMPATVTGFGAVFTDVDQPDGSEGSQGNEGKAHGRHRSHEANTTVIEYFDAKGNRIFSANVPSTPGDGGLSFFGVVFDDARIARVRITTGDTAPGRNDDNNHDIVMMDDFIYGEPQTL